MRKGTATLLWSIVVQNNILQLKDFGIGEFRFCISTSLFLSSREEMYEINMSRLQKSKKKKFHFPRCSLPEECHEWSTGAHLRLLCAVGHLDNFQFHCPIPSHLMGFPW